MKFEILSGRVVHERARFAGDPHDTVILVIEDSDKEQHSVKVKEADWAISKGTIYCYFGNWTRYTNKNSGISEKQFAAWAYFYEDLKDSVLENMQLLLGRKFPRDLSCRVVYDWGTEARRTIEQNPYRLLTFPRCGWKLTDQLYLDLGKPANALKRQTLCAAYDLAEQTNGSIWHPTSVVDKVIERSIQEDPKPAKAISLGVRAGLLSKRRTDGHDGRLHWDGDFEWIATGIEARQEIDLARMLAEFSSANNRWPDIPRGDLSDHQYDELMKALAGPVGILLGSAGTGKTFTAAQVIKACEYMSFEIGAPTGKAAVRLSEALSELGLADRARTNHSILGYNGKGYSHDARNPLHVDALFVDEGSMVDQEMMYRIFSALEVGTHVLIIGDPYQLPPVGPGAPLRDMARFLPTGTLAEVRRNSGAIVEAGQRIRDGKRFVVHDEYSPPLRNLVLKKAMNPDDQIYRMLECIDWAREQGLDPLWDVQVIAIVNKDSRLGTHNLNEVLQRHLNPGDPIRGTPFRVGDKVMQTKNTWMITKKDRLGRPIVDQDAVVNIGGAAYVANGEMGIVTSIDAKTMTVEMAQPRRVVMAFRGDVDEESEPGMTGSTFVLGYAITTHKSQGSQVKIAICMIDEHAGAKRLFDRSLLYTMITRAKVATIMVGQEETAQAACKRASIWNRKTFLRELFEETNGPREVRSLPVHSAG